MIFDEVDAGVGGAVAEMVGRQLAALGARGQVLCVTHLAQVASQARPPAARQQADRRAHQPHDGDRARYRRTGGGTGPHARRHRDHRKAREHAREMLKAAERRDAPADGARAAAPRRTRRSGAALVRDSPCGGSARRGSGCARRCRSRACWRRRAVALDAAVHELLDPAAVHADDVVVVLALVQLEDRRAALEMVALHQAACSNWVSTRYTVARPISSP
jgi:hypothetical protein